MHKLIIISALFFSSLSFAASSNIVGTYHCKGHTPLLDQNYAGIMSIKKLGQAYAVSTKYSDDQSSTGTGVSADENTFSVIYKDSKDASRTGVQHFTVLQHGEKLQSVWVEFGKDKVGTEHCMKIKSIS